jgi:Uma2 family endonuclease
MTTATGLVTANQFLRMKGDTRRELVRGELREMPPAGGERGHVTSRFHTLLAQHVYAHELGAVFAAETGFRLSRNPDTVRAPDTAFVAKRRVPAKLPQGFWPGAPDLAAEVVSPHDTVEDVEETVDDWIDAGTKMVLVINPRRKTVTIHRPKSQPVVLRAKDTFDPATLSPGSPARCPRSSVDHAACPHRF